MKKTKFGIQIGNFRIHLPDLVSHASESYVSGAFHVCVSKALYYRLSLKAFRSVIMSTPFKGGRHIVLLRLALALVLALASGLTLRHPCSIFFWVHQNMIPAIWRSFFTGDLDLQGQGNACRGHHLKNHLN